MRTDDMIPYYVLLKEYGTDTSEIIVGDKLWVVKTKFIEHYFDGQFTYISKDFSSKDKIEELLTLDSFNQALDRFKSLNPKLLDLKVTDKNDLKKAYSEFSKLVDDDNLSEALLDNAQKQGPYLDD